MIRIRSSASEVEVAATPAELRGVAARLVHVAEEGGVEVIACEADFDPAPFPFLLPRLRLERKEGKDRVSALSDQLELSGCSEALLRLASFFDMPDSADEGFHVHHEFLFEGGLVASDSQPLIVAVERAKLGQPPEPIR